MHHAQNRLFSLSRGFLVATCAVLCGVGASYGQMTLVGTSPFSPSGGALASGAAAPSQDFELAGSSSVGSDVSVCIYERQAKRSEWIPVGGNIDGIHVISFDPSNDHAVVMVSGQRKEISMRTAKIASANSGGYMSRPAPVASAPVQTYTPAATSPMPQPAAAVGPEQEQREARMLVSDLLEIGVQQRKAYQEARAKAAAGAQPGGQN